MKIIITSNSTADQEWTFDTEFFARKRYEADVRESSRNSRFNCLNYLVLNFNVPKVFISLWCACSTMMTPIEEKKDEKVGVHKFVFYFSGPHYVV